VKFTADEERIICLKAVNVKGAHFQRCSKSDVLRLRTLAKAVSSTIHIAKHYTVALISIVMIPV